MRVSDWRGTRWLHLFQREGYRSRSPLTNQIICLFALDKLIRMKRALPPLNSLRAFEAAGDPAILGKPPLGCTRCTAPEPFPDPCP
ncbi:hypothetical protein BCAR13_520189 [Paraburkholderia caribensis]|nr:hypothetical protein BCAR13_520189 [Paraburkholderia caribensis]